jgi:hypothetical protein
MTTRTYTVETHYVLPGNEHYFACALATPDGSAHNTRIWITPIVGGYSWDIEAVDGEAVEDLDKSGIITPDNVKGENALLAGDAALVAQALDEAIARVREIVDPED